MINSINDCTVLNNSVKMPWLGFGVAYIDADKVKDSVLTAIKAGYRSIDTAKDYGNEEDVGNAVRECDIPRNELFITTKVWNADQGYEQTLKAFEVSRQKLGLDYIDLYLIHWPVKEKFKETWKALEKLYRDGFVRAIGVSNFNIHHLEELINSSSINPMINQVELHPLLSQKKLRDFCKSNKIQIEAWSPLMQGALNIPELVNIGKKYGKTPAQVVLRWDIQNGIVTIPKSSTERRIIENSDIFDFELSSEDMNIINGLNENKRLGPDPDNFNF